MKIVINSCYGGFSLSLEAARFMAERGHAEAVRAVREYERDNAWIDAFKRTGVWPEECPHESIKWLKIDAEYGQHRQFLGYFDVERNDALLIAAVETLGEKAGGECAKLTIVEIPDGVDWCIEEYDGKEHVAEQHRTCM
jgi:hypothetical protein